MSLYKLVNKDGDVSHRKTKKELDALLKKRRSKGETGWRLVKKSSKKVKKRTNWKNWKK